MLIRRTLIILPLLLPLCACDGWIPDWANSAGNHMPVVGERCENWQCFTEGGREQSRMNIQMEQMRAAQEKESESRGLPPTPPPLQDPYDEYH